MNLSFSQEQQMLQDSVARFVSQRYGAAARKAVAASPARINLGVWRSMAEFGWLALSIPEACGGLGGSAVDAGILMEGLGRALVLEPVCTSSILCTRLVATQGSAAQRAAWLPQLADGSLRAALAHGEGAANPYGEAPATRAVRTASGWRLDGRKPLVFDAPGAGLLLVSAQIQDGTGVGQTAVFAVPADTVARGMQAFDTIDGRRAAALDLKEVALDHDALLGDTATAAVQLERALDAAVSASCAEAVGAMQFMLDATVDYTKTRTQFGRTLASNQVLAHRMVDMAVQCEEARAISLRAALFCDAEGDSVDADQRGRAVSGAKLKVSAAARFVAENAVQLHGAMGVTDELDIGAYFKRVLCFEMAWGTPADHMARCLRLRALAQE